MPKHPPMKSRGSKLFFHIALIAAVIAFAMTDSAWATSKVNIKGYLVLESDPYRFIEVDTLKSYKLRISTDIAKQAVAKLKNFDGISGVAVLYDEETLLLESVEFVGLRRLLGKWKSPTEVFQFVDYNRLQVKTGPKKVEMTYALSPGFGNSWRLFFTDENSVTLGSLEIQNENAEIQLYDSENGSILKTVPLTRVKE